MSQREVNVKLVGNDEDDGVVLHYHPGTPFPHHASVSQMEIHPPNDELPRLADLMGTAPDCTGALSAVDFVRSIRDE